MNTKTSPLRIDVVSDVVCPWCAIGLASLQEALRRFATGTYAVWYPMLSKLESRKLPERRPGTPHGTSVVLDPTSETCLRGTRCQLAIASSTR